MEGYTYEASMDQNYSDDKKHLDGDQEYYLENNALSSTAFQMSKSQLAHLRESPAAKERRLARNAERMREKRAAESFDEYRIRLNKNALNNRVKRQKESTTEKTLRQVRDAARQRMRRAMEDPVQRAERLQKLAERMRVVRRNESPDKKVQRLVRAAQRARERLQNETEQERKNRLQKSSEYARRIRSSKSHSNSISECDSSLTDYDQKPITANKVEAFNNNSAHANQNCVVQNNHQVIYQHQQPQVFQQQQIITIPSVRTEKIINNIPKMNPQPPHYVQSVQFALPPGYTYSNNYQTVVREQHQNETNNMTMQHAGTTLNIPQYHHTLIPFQNPQKIIQPGNIKIENEPNIPFQDDFCQNNDVSGKMIERLVKVEIIDVPKIPKRFKESEDQRRERLRVTAEKSRIRRQHENSEQREKRLNDLKTRARKRREETKLTENGDERNLRLSKQAQYARSRRMKINSLEGKQTIERKARELYAKIHDNSQSSEKPSALKILEPIIEMNTT